MSPRIVVFVGPGGVGKTTLAAAHALAHAATGARVGLFGIDPARRLETALGVALDDAAAPVPGAPGLSAAILRPEVSLRRWGRAAGLDAGLLDNPFFLALADRLAGATDLIAALRLAEWVDAEPSLDALVVDTAPGQNAIEFLARPERLRAFFAGRLGRWLGRLARPGATRARLLGEVVSLTGAGLFTELAELLAALEQSSLALERRVDAAQALVRSPATEVVLVTTARHDTATADLAASLAGIGVHPRRVVLNRAVGAEVRAAWTSARPIPGAERLLAHAQGLAKLEGEAAAALAAGGLSVLEVPPAEGLDGPDRIARLTALGHHLRPLQRNAS